METFEQKLARVLNEKVDLVEYDTHWDRMFLEEKRHLESCLPSVLVKRIEHFGSTAVPRMPAKPIIDILVEVTSLERTKNEIVPILESQGYEYFWRASFGEATPPFYAWFIKRDTSGNRTHHIHMVEKNYKHWDRLLFRDYLRENAVVAKEYADLKMSLSRIYRNDRVRYTDEKTKFITRITRIARSYYQNANSSFDS